MLTLVSPDVVVTMALLIVDNTVDKKCTIEGAKVFLSAIAMVEAASFDNRKSSVGVWILFDYMRINKNLFSLFFLYNYI